MADLILDLVTKGGPYSIIAYLLWDRERLLRSVEEALDDAKGLREQRAQDLQRGTEKYLELAYATRDVLRDVVEGLRGRNSQTS